MHSFVRYIRGIIMLSNIHRKKKRKGKGRSDPLPMKVQNGLRSVMDFIACVYLVLMIAVMPLYFRDGYSYIATDKAYFCHRINIYAFRALIPVSAVYLAGSLAAFLRRGRLTKAVWLELLRKVWAKTALPDKFMGLYGIALIISYLCSDYKDTALWGEGNGWYTGFLPQLMLIGAYFFIARFWKPRKSFFYCLFPVSAAVFLLGYLNRFGIYPIEMKMSSPSFISTIGNINWYCGYAVTVLFAGVALIWSGIWRLWQRILLYGYALLGFATLTTQGSSSGIVALGIILAVLFVMSADSGEKMCRFWAAAALLSSACLFTRLFRDAAPERINLDDEWINLLTTGSFPIIMTIASLLLLALFYIAARKGVYPQKSMRVLAKIAASLVSCGFVLFLFLIVFNTRHPGSLGRLSVYPVFSFSDSWGSNRGASWKAGILCFLEQDFLHKLTGVGPDAMSAYLRRDSGEGLRQMLDNVFANIRLTNAHNEWLTALVNTGILGLAGFGGTMVTAIGTFLKGSKKAASDDGSGYPICCACGFSLLAYTINNIFSFQQTVSLTTMMVILGMGMAFLRADSSSA